VTVVIDPKGTNKLAKVCGMFGSDHAGERAAAAALADRMVRELACNGPTSSAYLWCPLNPSVLTASVANALDVCLDHVHS